MDAGWSRLIPVNADDKELSVPIVRLLLMSDTTNVNELYTENFSCHKKKKKKPTNNNLPSSDKPLN